MTIGADIKAAWKEIGVSYTIIRDGGNVTGEYGYPKINAQVTKPFIREFFTEIKLAYDTQVVAGDVIQTSDGRIFLVMNSTPKMVENAAYQYEAVLYKTNVAGTIKRQVNTRVNYVTSVVWSSIKSSCYALLTESQFGNEMEGDEIIGWLSHESHLLYIPHSFGLQVNDRFDVSQGGTTEYYKVVDIKTRQYSGIDLAQLEEDTR